MRRRLIRAKSLINKEVVERFTWHGSLVPGVSADPQFIDIEETMRTYNSNGMGLLSIGTDPQFDDIEKTTRSLEVSRASVTPEGI